MGLALLRAKMSPIARGFIAWFGPRGLSALLLALLVVEAGIPQATNLLAITGVVVLVSVLVHGVSATPASRWYGQKIAQASVTMAEKRESDASGLFEGEASDIPRVSPEELRAMLDESHSLRLCWMYALGRISPKEMGRFRAAFVCCQSDQRMDGACRRSRKKNTWSWRTAPDPTKLLAPVWRVSYEKRGSMPAR